MTDYDYEHHFIEHEHGLTRDRARARARARATKSANGTNQVTWPCWRAAITVHSDPVEGPIDYAHLYSRTVRSFCKKFGHFSLNATTEKPLKRANDNAKPEIEECSRKVTESSDLASSAPLREN